MLPVIFRKFPEGDVIALFPTLPGNNDYMVTCESYMHIGQHSSARVALIDSTAPANEEEYAGLLRELESIGYEDLKVYKRYQRGFTVARVTEYKRMRGEL